MYSWQWEQLWLHTHTIYLIHTNLHIYIYVYICVCFVRSCDVMSFVVASITLWRAWYEYKTCQSWAGRVIIERHVNCVILEHMLWLKFGVVTSDLCDVAILVLPKQASQRSRRRFVLLARRSSCSVLCVACHLRRRFISPKVCRSRGRTALHTAGWAQKFALLAL